MIETFNEQNHAQLCEQLANKDRQLRQIIDIHGYPPVWTRSQRFSSLVHIILEQQVSLASAKAAFLKLKEYIGRVTPQKILQLSDEELRTCYFSRQKTIYVRQLAQAIDSGQLRLSELRHLPDDAVRAELKKIKGIGDWTADIYLLFALQRCDIFPVGDLAMVNAFKEVKGLAAKTGNEKIVLLAENWRPYRSIATHLLWHHYIKSRNIKL
jgi:DNA-3-methyladenine glycosylase II